MKYSDETAQQQIDRIYNEAQQERRRLLAELEAAKASRPTISEARVREIAAIHLASFEKWWGHPKFHPLQQLTSAIRQALREARVEVTKT